MKYYLFLLIILIPFYSLAQLNGEYLIGTQQPYPFNNIKNAIVHINSVGINSKVIFLLEDTLYIENDIIINPIVGSSQQNTLTIKPKNNIDVIIRNETVDKFTFNINEAQYIIIGDIVLSNNNSLIFENLEQNALPSIGLIQNIFSSKTYSHIHIYNSKFYNSGIGSLIYFRDAIDVIINNCSFYNAKTAILCNSNKLLISNNRFFNCDVAILNSQKIETTITGNYFNNCKLATDISCSTSKITRNTIVGGDNSLCGIRINGEETEISNNIITGNLYRGIVVSNGNARILYNTISLYPITIKEEMIGSLFPHINITCIGILDCIKSDIINNLLKIQNNLNVESNLISATFDQGYYFQQIDNNLYWINESNINHILTTQKPISPTQYETYTVNNLSNWQADFPMFNSNSHFEIPSFVSETDLHLSEDCNRGTPLTDVLLDFDAIVRSTLTPDIGAYEIAGCPTTFVGTYHIGQSEPYPFNTITNTVNCLNTSGVSGAVTFLLTDNLYEESGIEFITVSGTSVTNTITLRPTNGVDVEIKGDGEFVIGFDRTSHLSFEGKSPDNTGSLTITSTETVIGSSVIKATTPINTSGNTLNIHINSCTINAAPPFFSEEAEPKTYGFNFPSTNNNVHTDSLILNNNFFTGGDISINSKTIDISAINNKFISSGGISIFAGGTASIKIQKNTFENTNICYSHGGLSIIYTWGGLKVDIKNNIFDGINYNFVSFNKEFSAFDFSGKNVTITNNIIKNINYNATFTPVPNFDLGSLFQLFSFNYTENLKFYHNSIYIPKGGENGFLSGEHKFIGFDFSNNQNIEFKNNIITVLQGNKEGETVNSEASIFSFGYETDIANLHADNNTYFVNNHTGNYFYSVGLTQNYDFTQWQTTYPTQDQNSYWEMPKVISKNDLHLSEDCNRGTPLAEVSLDFDAIVRSNITPDIGAYEYINQLGFINNENCQYSLIQFNITNGVNIQSALWDFGDSQTSTEFEPTHIYTNAGTYTVTLTVTYTDNQAKTISKEIDIFEKPLMPIIQHK